MHRIKYRQEVSFEGRNGMFRQSGVEIMEQAAECRASLFPITSRGQVGRGMLEIPLDSIDDVIYALIAIKTKLARKNYDNKI